jgi:hypothetical protein
VDHGAACRQVCEDAHQVLGKACGNLLQPGAARSRAICHARVIEVGRQCLAKCAD